MKGRGLTKSIATLAGLSLALSACLNGAPQDKDEKKEEASAPLGAGGRVRGVTTFSPSSTQSSTALFVPGTDTVLSLWKAQLTFFGTSYDASAALALTLVPGTIVSNPDLVPLSPLLAFRATDEGAATLTRADVATQLKVETILDRKIDPEDVVALIILGRGTATEERYALLPSDLSIVERADGSSLVTFSTRDADFAYAVAASTGGRVPATYSPYPNVPPDNAEFAANGSEVSDAPAEARLTWTPSEGSRVGYLLAVAYDGDVPPEGCTGGTVLPAAEIVETRTTFPIKASSDTYFARALEDGKLATFRLCSLNARTPADASPGITASLQLPARALATLAGSPANPANAAALSVVVAGDDVTHYKYALLGEEAAASPTGCADASYSADWIAVATWITDALTEGAHRLCVVGKISATNAQLASGATEIGFTIDHTAPEAFTIAAATTPTNDTTPAFSWSASIGAATYDVSIATDAACAVRVQSENQALLTYTATTLADGDYWLCVTALDAATNETPATNTSWPFEVDTQPPTFTSLALANAAADTYLTLAEHAASTALVGTLTAAEYALAEYDLVAATTACDVALTYGAIPMSDDAGFDADGLYKVCVELTDDAGNVTYGASATMTLDTVVPAFTSLTGATSAVDGFLNIVEHAASTDLVTAVVGSGHDAADYAVVANATACSGVGTWGALPRSDAAAFVVSEASYKVCVRLTDLAGNPAAYGASLAIVYDVTPPTLTSLTNANDALDGFLNLAERTFTGVVGTAVAGGSAAETFALVPAATACTSGLPYGAMPTSDSTTFGADGVYKVCARLVDTAGNPTYASDATFVLDTLVPGFTSLARANAAADGFVSIADHLLTTDLAGSVSGTGYDTAAYSLEEFATACSGVAVFAAMPKADDPRFAVSESDYKVCVRLSDAAGNPPAFGPTSAITYDVTPPTLTSLDNADEAADGYLNLAERVATGDLGAAVSAGSVADAFVLVPSATACTNLLTYGAMPKSDSTAFVGDGAYKVCASLVDAAGNPTYDSDATFFLDTQAPSAFTITAPATNDHTPTVTWTDPTDATDYDVALDDSSGCGTALQNYSGVVTLSQTMTTLGDATYYVCVSALDAAGNATPATNTNLSFALTTGTWTATDTIAAPTARSGARAVWAGDRMIVWGGYSGAAYLAAGAEYAPAGDVWTPVEVTNEPSLRGHHVAVWTGAAMFVWGGSDGAVLGDGGMYDPAALAGSKWSAVAGGGPSARREAAAVWSGTTVLVFGGHDGTTPVATGGVYDPTGLGTWSTLDVTGGQAPAARESAGGVWTGAKMIVWGGKNGTGVNTGSIYDPTQAVGSRWTTITTTDAPSGRWGHSMIWTGTRLIVFGGTGNGTNRLADGGIYDPAMDDWEPLSTTEGPTARMDHVASWDGTRMYVFGGHDGTTAVAGGGAYRPASGAWTVPRLQLTGAPGARFGAACVWTGTQMLVWGGDTGSGKVNSGGRFTPP